MRLLGIDHGMLQQKCLLLWLGRLRGLRGFLHTLHAGTWEQMLHMSGLDMREIICSRFMLNALQQGG